MKLTSKWWSPAVALRRLGWTGFSPLSSLADIGEPRIGVMSDAFLQPMLIDTVFRRSHHNPHPIRYGC